MSRLGSSVINFLSIGVTSSSANLNSISSSFSSSGFSISTGSNSTISFFLFLTFIFPKTDVTPGFCSSFKSPFISSSIFSINSTCSVVTFSEISSLIFSVLVVLIFTSSHSINSTSGNSSFFDIFSIFDFVITFGLTSINFGSIVSTFSISNRSFSYGFSFGFSFLYSITSIFLLFRT